MKRREICHPLNHDFQDNRDCRHCGWSKVRLIENAVETLAVLDQPQSERVSRISDTNPSFALALYRGDTGDVTVSIIPRGGRLPVSEHATIEFAGAGGGTRSPHTRRALRALMAAIERDQGLRPDPK